MPANAVMALRSARSLTPIQRRLALSTTPARASAVVASPLAARQIAVRHASTAIGAPDGTPRRRFLPRLFLYTTLSLAVFYGVSIPASLASEAYSDFFVENAPFGEQILDYFEAHHIGDDLKTAQLGEYGSKAIGLASSGFKSVSGAVERVFDSAKDTVDTYSSKAKDSVDSVDARAQLKEARAGAKEKVVKVEKRVKKAADEAKSEAGDVADAAAKGVQKLVDAGKVAAAKAEEQIFGAASSSKQAVEDAAAKAAPKGKPFPGSLPVSHEAPAGYVASSGDRKLTPPDNKLAKLRDDPGAPKLPKLAPALSSLSGSEPMVRQLAGTIDDLASFLRDTPSSGANAQGVLADAKKELDSLGERLEAIKKAEAARVERTLAQQAKDFDAKLVKAQKEAEAKVGQVDAEWQKKQKEETDRQRKTYEEQLRTELATQSEIINERLKEEVIAQGIEMQRRWMRDIKARVEEERGGRLAKLDELATDLKSLERVALDNASALDSGAHVHQLAAALRAATSAALSDDDEAHQTGSAAPKKRSFRNELRVLRNSPRAREDPVFSAALDVLEASPATDEGVESFSTLYRWFEDKVKPSIQRVALVPEHAGVLSHLTSSLLSPLLFSKKGFVEGGDVPSVLARVEWYLERKNLDDAARELNQLKGWPKVLAEDWLQAARNRLEAQQALEVMAAESSFASLQVA